MFHFVHAAGVATRRTVEVQGYMVALVAAGVGVVIGAWRQDWKWDEPLAELGLFLTYFVATVAVSISAIFIWNLARSRALMLVLESGPDQLPVAFARENFDRIALSAPYVSFFFTVTNKTDISYTFSGDESGFLSFVDTTWHDPWTLIVDTENFRIPAHSSIEIEIRQRVPPDLMSTFAGYRGRDDFPLDFSNLRIPVKSDRVGPLSARFILKMPDAWTHIAVPQREHTGFGPRYGRFILGEALKEIGGPNRLSRMMDVVSDEPKSESSQ